MTTMDTPAVPERRTRVGTWVALGCSAFFVLALVGGVAAVAATSYLSGITTGSSGIFGPSRPSSEISAYIAAEYPDYTVVDSVSFGRIGVVGLSGSQFLLRAQSGTFPGVLRVAVYNGGLTDIPADIRDDYVESSGFVTDDGLFSASRLTTYVLSPNDLAAMGKAFYAQMPGKTSIISSARFDDEYRFATFLVAGDAPEEPSFTGGRLGITHIGQLSQNSGGLPWEAELTEP